MKKIRLLLLVVAILLLSGCSGTYNIKINDNFSVDENVDLLIDNKDEETYKQTKALFEENNISKDDYKIKVTDKNINIKYKESYNSLEDYILNSKLYKQLFNNLNYSYKDGILVFDTKSKMLLTDNGESALYNNYNISMLQINIETPFKVKDSNADLDNDNILSWTLNKDTTSKEIKVEYDAAGSRNNIKDIIIIAMMVIIVIGSVVVLIIRFNNSKKI